MKLDTTTRIVRSILDAIQVHWKWPECIRGSIALSWYFLAARCAGAGELDNSSAFLPCTSTHAYFGQ